MRKFVLCMTAVLGFQQAYAMDLTKEFITKHGFTIHAPDGWVEIPAEVLAEHSLTLKDNVPESNVQKYEYGYKIQSENPGITYPYILVQVNETGKIPEDTLRLYDRVVTAIDKETKVAEKELSRILGQIEREGTIYDSKNVTLWTTMSTQENDAGNITALLVVKLTEIGYIQLAMYSTEKTYKGYEESFFEIASNITLDPELEYKQQPANAPETGINYWKVLNYGLQGAGITAIFGLVSWFALWLFKKKQTSLQQRTVE